MAGMDAAMLRWPFFCSTRAQGLNSRKNHTMADNTAGAIRTIRRAKRNAGTAFKDKASQSRKLYSRSSLMASSFY